MPDHLSRRSTERRVIASRSATTGRQVRDVLANLHGELSARHPDWEEAGPNTATETLYQRVARARARWLRRIMYGSLAISTEKCFAYAVYEHLNCVTLDAWPAQIRLAQLLGLKSVKTIQRSARGLEELSVLVIKRSDRGQFRYAPVFLPGDEDRNDQPIGHTRPGAKDTDVHESLLLIHTNTSTPTSGTAEGSGNGQSSRTRYRSSQRGSIEIKIAAMLGDDGIDVLSGLGAIDDSIIERLCRAYNAGALGQRE